MNTETVIGYLVGFVVLRHLAKPVAGVGKIYPSQSGGLLPCNDNTFSSSEKRGTCSHHKGIKKGQSQDLQRFENNLDGFRKRLMFGDTSAKHSILNALESFKPHGWRPNAIKYKKVLAVAREFGISGVYKEIPQFFECNDGYLTTGSCSWHSGFKSRTPLEMGAGGSTLLRIRDVPLSQIHIDYKLFQGREKAFSQRSVENIVNDVLSGRFVWENFDPVTLWLSPEGKMFLLSGHSRTEAFRRLAEMRATADGKGFDRIPAKIRTGDLQQARRLALESNTLSTKETDIERAAYYRRLRQDGLPEKELLAQIRKNEGRNAANIYAYTFLNPDGKTWAMVRQFAESEDTSANTAKSLAKWIGAARREYPMLTNEHERELHDWLFEHRGYGTSAGQVSKETDFQEKVGRFISKNTEFGVFDQHKPLNILNSLTKSPAEQEYDRKIADLQKQIQDLDNHIKIQTRSLTARNATKDDLQRILAPFEAQLRNLRADLQKKILQKSNIIEYGKREAALFGLRRRRNLFTVKTF